MRYRVSPVAHFAFLPNEFNLRILVPCNLLGGWISLRLPCPLISRSFPICGAYDREARAGSILKHANVRDYGGKFMRRTRA
jgi:hypothetical protein